jgi:hypothetical protein
MKVCAELVIDEVVVQGRAIGSVDALRDELAVRLRSLLVERADRLPSGELRLDAVSIEAPPELALESLAAHVARALIDRLAKGGEP